MSNEIKVEKIMRDKKVTVDLGLGFQTKISYNKIPRHYYLTLFLFVFMIVLTVILTILGMLSSRSFQHKAIALTISLFVFLYIFTVIRAFYSASSTLYKKYKKELKKQDERNKI